MEYVVGFFVGVVASVTGICIQRRYYSYYSARGMSFFDYNCGSKTARFRNMGTAPLRVWIKVYQPEPSPHPSNNPTMVAGVNAASQNMDYWVATNNSWPSTGDVFVFGWYEQSPGAYGLIGPCRVNCMGGSSSPPPPPLPPPPLPPPPLPPPPGGP